MNAITKNARRLISRRNYSVVLANKQDLWTSDNIVKSPYKDVAVPTCLVTDHVWQNVEKWADKTAVVCGVTNRSYTYSQLYNYSRNFACKLRKQFKIHDGDVVCFMLPNLPEYCLAVLGALQAGAQVTTINPIYTSHEVHRQLVLSNPKIIIGTPETVKVIRGAFEIAKKEIPIITVKNIGEDLPLRTISFQELVQDDNVDHSVLKEVRRQPEDVAFLPYSSGTTGLPKGVELLNRNVVVNCIQQNVEGVKHYDDTTSLHQDSVLAVLPFYHIYGLSIIMLHKLSIGAKLVTLPKFQPNTFLNALEVQKVNLLYVVPPMVLFLGSHSDVKKEHLESVHKMVCGAAPLPRHDIDKVLERAKPDVKFIQIYGLTETSPLVTAMVPGSDNYSSAGYPIPNTEIKIIDSNSQTLGPNEVGELLIRGPQVMKGYRDNPEATEGTFSEDGWFKSGDLASIDEQGALFISDRLKELIKVKGYQVPPAELESVLKEHPDVLDAAVVGVPDERMGEVPRAFIVSKNGHKAKPRNLVDHVAERVAEYKRIKDITFVDSLPRNPSGKLLRRVLKEKYC